MDEGPIRAPPKQSSQRLRVLGFVRVCVALRFRCTGLPERHASAARPRKKEAGGRSAPRLRWELVAVRGEPGLATSWSLPPPGVRAGRTAGPAAVVSLDLRTMAGHAYCTLEPAASRRGTEGTRTAETRKWVGTDAAAAGVTAVRTGGSSRQRDRRNGHPRGRQITSARVGAARSVFNANLGLLLCHMPGTPRWWQMGRAGRQHIPVAESSIRSRSLSR